jgi:hypothetical protein
VHTLGSQPIEVRSFQPLGSLRMKSEKVMPVIIGKNKDDVLGEGLGCTQ